MSVAAGALLYQEPGKVPSVVLAVLVHVLLAVFLFFGVHWQSRQPEAVMVELWNSPPAPAVAGRRPGSSPRPSPSPNPSPNPKSSRNPRWRKRSSRPSPTSRWKRRKK